ncbi:hypothetical protein LCGC14_3061210 [marine sediment metagenome]|uniref:Archease domain-containing protein n=1 Tax=marine sediment metagenome TaxID=412755 RepID=A0A0F8WJD9_9ZZZZ
MSSPTTRTVETDVRVPRGDSGHIRGPASEVLVALTAIQTAIAACANEVEAPQGVDPIATISLSQTDVHVSVSYTEDDG